MTEEQTQQAAPRRGWGMTPEHKQKMKEGRERAKAARRQAKAGLPPRPAPTPKPPPQPRPEPGPGPAWDDEAEDSEFLGMTGGQGWNNRCPNACNEKQGCVITREGSGICGHPEKSGLQTADQQRPKIVERYARARKYLAHQKVDRR
jgi:hypothetical protein